MKITFFNQSIGDRIAKLDKPTTAKTLRTLDLLEKFGNELGMPHSKNIGANLFELRVQGKNKIRIIYCFHKNMIVLLHALIKKTQKIPKQDIFLAKKRLNSLDCI